MLLKNYHKENIQACFDQYIEIMLEYVFSIPVLPAGHLSNNRWFTRLILLLPIVSNKRICQENHLSGNARDTQKKSSDADQKPEGCFELTVIEFEN